MMVAYQFADDRVLLYEDRGWMPLRLWSAWLKSLILPSDNES